MNDTKQCSRCRRVLSTAEFNRNRSTKDGLQFQECHGKARNEVPSSGLTFGPPVYYRPICVLTGIGFIGGPSGYMEVDENEKDSGPLIVTPTKPPTIREAEGEGLDDA